MLTQPHTRLKVSRTICKHRPVRGAPPSPPKPPRRGGDWWKGKGHDGSHHKSDWLILFRDLFFAISLTAFFSGCMWVSMRVGKNTWIVARSEALAWTTYRPIR